MIGRAYCNLRRKLFGLRHKYAANVCTLCGYRKRGKAKQPEVTQ